MNNGLFNANHLKLIYKITDIIHNDRYSITQIVSKVIKLLNNKASDFNFKQIRLIYQSQQFGPKQILSELFLYNYTLKVKKKNLILIQLFYEVDVTNTNNLTLLESDKQFIETIMKQLTVYLELKKTEQKSVLQQEQLFQASKMAALGTLVSGVAHEINNPNNWILQSSTMLKRIMTDAMPILEQHHESNNNFSLSGMTFLEMKENLKILFSGITDGSKRIKDIVEEMKDFARQNISSKKENSDLNDVVKSAIRIIKTSLLKSTLNFKETYYNRLPLVKINPQRIEQVIINLLLNAAQSLSNNTKKISIKTFLDPKTNHVGIIIQDEGVGIPKELLPRIFDPFFTTKRDTGGTGLGLSISATIIEEHKGKLNFISSPGKGTTATLTLPI